MKPKRAVEAALAGGGARRETFGAWLRFGEKLLTEAGVALGQVAAHPHDEALYLLLHVLGLPLESGPEVLKKKLTGRQQAAAREIFRRRVIDRVPAAYLTREAWLDGRRFYVDERVIIPRSYFLEIIPRLSGMVRVPPGQRPGVQARSATWLPHKDNFRFADVCTGSGCLAILLALEFPRAKVDAIDLSPAALAVTRINIAAHRVGRRVTPRLSDVFAAVPPVRYDAIISNPPYEPSAHVDRLAAEFRAEPRLALDGGDDGLDIIRTLLKQAPARLTPRGVLLIEVGGLQAAINREFRKLKPEWIATEDGSNCICLFRASNL